jgi:ankyrin repeat protein
MGLPFAESPDGSVHISVALFHLAAAKGNLTKVLELLIKGEVHISAADEDQFTALHFAAFCGTDDVARALILHGALVNDLDRFGRAPLHLAARRGSLSISRMLVDHGAALDLIDLQHSTPLHLASFHGHLKTVQLLLGYGADPNIRTDDLWTPLHLAASTGAVHIVKLLLSCGASPSTVNKDSWAALHLAAESSHDDTIRLLLEFGASLNAVTSDLWTPLHLAVWGRSLGTVRLLLQAGANVNVLSKDEVAPIHFAIKNGDHDLVDLLLRAGANINGTGESCSSLLHLAARFGRLEIAQLLLDHGASPSATNSKDQTPRDLALGYYDDVAELLLVPEVQLHATNDVRRPISEAGDDQSILHSSTVPSSVNRGSPESIEAIGTDMTSNKSDFCPSQVADPTHTTTEHAPISELRRSDSSKDEPSKRSQITDEGCQKHREDTLSTTDSFTDYPMENGRRYPKYHGGAGMFVR